MGRTEASGDGCAITQFQTSFKTSTYSYAGLVKAFATSDAFRYVPSNGGM